MSSPEATGETAAPHMPSFAVGVAIGTVSDCFDLGAYTRPVTTTSPDAQRWFDLGLKWCFAFNHEEGVKCFRKALEFDADCLMAHWGVAYGSGPFYNFVWRDFGAQEAAVGDGSCVRSHPYGARVHRAGERRRE